MKFLDTGFNSASYNFALDEVLLDWVAVNKVPVLRFYGFEPTSCTIGYFQGMEMEIDLEKAKENKVECVRRLTGGGAVMHDKNQFTYSLIIPEDLVPSNILNSYEYICKPLILGLNKLGLNPEFAPLNDIILNAQKISGNAQTRKKGCVLQHGTLLLEADVDLMFSLLKVPDEKIRHKLIQSVKKRVTGINDHLTNPINYQDLVDLLSKEFANYLNLQLEFDLGIESLENKILEIQNSKYCHHAWNYKY